MKLSNLILRAIFIISIISTLFAFATSILFQYNSFKTEGQYIKEEFLTLKKEEIKREVSRVHANIKHRQNLIEQEIKEKLKTRVEEAHAIATAIYSEFQGKKSDEEIKKIIVTSLKDISFNEKRSYFFINSNTGRAILFNKKPSLDINKNIWNIKDIQGNYIVRRQSELALTKGEGFVTNYFIKPDLRDNKEYPKLSFIKYFKPFNWHIGTGEYIDDMIHQTKQEILEQISNIRFGNNGYIFVNTLDRKALVYDGKKLKTPKHYGNDKLFEQQFNAQLNPEGGFLFYKFKKLNTQEAFNKVAFVKTYKEWKWIIGSGVYIDDIDTEIARKESILKNAILGQINTLLFFLLLIAVCIFLLSKKISSYINNNILHLIKSFKKASKIHKQIDTKELTFKEFIVLAKNINKTLDSRNKAESKLEDYVKIINDNVSITVTDTAGIITDVSNTFCKYSGYDRKELIGQPHSLIRHPDVPKEFYTQMWEKLESGQIWSGEIKNRNKKGQTYWVQATIQPNYEKGNLIGYTSIRHDITDKKKVEYLSITDELTQLNNRRHFNTKIEEEISRAKREDYYLSFMMLDIDYFKKYNDTYGHQAGDEALKKISAVLKEHTHRASDFAFRLGGEEFAIIFLLDNKAKSLQFANLIKNEIENLKIKHSESSISSYITASIGLVVKKGSQLSTSTALYKEADKFLYKAKARGRNNVFC